MVGVGLLFTVQPCAAMELLVYTNSDAGAGTLRKAIADNNAMGGGNTIIFSNTVQGTITLTSGQLVIANVTIAGPGPGVLAVSGNDSNRVFYVTNGNVNATITGLSIVNGRAAGNFGGGIANFGGTLVVSNCIVSNCFASRGGGISSSGTGIILWSAIVSNQANFGGAGFEGSGYLTNCTFARNNGPYAVDGPYSIFSSTVADNTAEGVNSNPNGTAIGNSILAGNSGLDAVGVFFQSAGYNIVGKADGSFAFRGNAEQLGSTNSPLDAKLAPLGFYGFSTPTMPPHLGSPAIDKGRRFGLTTDQRGRPRPFTNAIPLAPFGDHSDIGAVEIGPPATLVVMNTNDSGPGSLRQTILDAYPSEATVTFAAHVTNLIGLTSGELSLNKSLNIFGPGAKELSVSGNKSNRVFHLTGGNLLLSGLTIANGSEIEGGGIRVDGGDHIISSCQVVRNAATGPFGFGGGGLLLTGNASLSVWDSSILHNEAGYTGGGIYHRSSNALSIINCTIASNRVIHPPQIGYPPHGGGITLNYGVLNIYDSTLASNTATRFSGGIDNSFNPKGTANIYNSIVAGNSATQYPDVAGPFTSAGYNLIGNTNGSTGFGVTGDQIGVNPSLGALADYGGPTLTMALRAGSPAIDQGKSFGATIDQRGFPRPLDDSSITNASGGDGADIGAFEVDPSFRIVDVQRVGADVALNLTTVLGRNYRAEYTNNLAPGNWTTFSNNVPGNGYLLWVTNYGGATQPRRFYRGAIVP
jgi:fibronectin-binding autotransporter adhesin